MKLFKRAEKKQIEMIDGGELLTGYLNPESINREKAMSIPAFSSCVHKISDTIAGLPIKLYRETEGKVEEIKKDKRLILLNNETGDTLNSFEFKKALIMDYYLGKGGYAYIQKEGLNITGLYYVDESQVSFNYNNDPIFKSYTILVNGSTYYDYNFLRILRNTKNGYKGNSIINEHQEVLQTVYTTMKLEKNLVAGGGHKKGFLESEKKLAKEAIDKLKEAWKKLYGNNDEKVIVLNDGIKFKEAGNTSVEMQLNENKKTNSDDMCKIFGVTPSFINGKLTEADEKSNMKFCFNPLLNSIETALNSSLLLENEKGSYFFAFDVSELIKTDIDKRYASYKTAIESGIMSIDEVRYKENLPRLGFDYLKMTLADGLYNHKNKTVSVLNTGKVLDIENLKGGENIESGNQSQ